MLAAFLWADVATLSVLKQVQRKPELDDVLYASGAIVWRVGRKDITRSGMTKQRRGRRFEPVTAHNAKEQVYVRFRGLLAMRTDVQRGREIQQESNM